MASAQKEHADSAAEASRREHLLQDELDALRHVWMSAGDHKCLRIFEALGALRDGITRGEIREIVYLLYRPHSCQNSFLRRCRVSLPRPVLPARIEFVVVPAYTEVYIGDAARILGHGG